MSEHPNVELMRRGYAAFATGDMDTLRTQLFHPDIIWHEVGDNPTSGDYRGTEQVLGLFLNMFQTTDGTFSVHLDSIVGADDLVIGIGGADAARKGQKLTGEPFCHVARIKNGKMVEAWIVNLDQPRVDAFYRS